MLYTKQISIADAAPSCLNRISSSPEWDGLEGRGERGDPVHTFHGYQVDSVATRRQELSGQSGHEGRIQGYFRWLFERCELLRYPLIVPPDADRWCRSCACGASPNLFFQNHDKLVSLFKQHFSTQLESKEVSFRGWNWGSTDFQGSVWAHQPLGSSHTD